MDRLHGPTGLVGGGRAAQTKLPAQPGTPGARHSPPEPRASHGQVVGWYSTGVEVNDSSILFHEFYGQEVERPVHLLLDLGLGASRMSCKVRVSGLGLGLGLANPNPTLTMRSSHT